MGESFCSGRALPLEVAFVARESIVASCSTWSIVAREHFADREDSCFLRRALLLCEHGCSGWSFIDWEDFAAWESLVAREYSSCMRVLCKLVPLLLPGKYLCCSGKYCR